MKIKKANWKYLLVYLGTAIFYLWMAAQIPYTHDDWDWGLPVGIHLWLHGIYNSRYIGNFFEVIMTRSELIKTLVMGLGYWLLPFLMSEFSAAEVPVTMERDKKRVLSFVLCNLLLLAMDRLIWQQTYGWVAGYGNFGLSAIFVLIILRKALRVFENGTNKEPVRNGAIWIVVGLVSQLFLENIALYLCALTLCALIYSYWKNRRISWSYLGLALGSVAGLVIMFGSGIYQDLWNSGSAVEGYRNVYVNSEADLFTALVQCFRQASGMPYRIWEDNLAVSCTILLLLSGGMLWAANEKNRRSRTGFLAANVLILMYFVSNHVVDLPFRWGYKLLIDVVFFLIVGAETLFLFGEDKAFTGRMMVIWLSAPAVIAPLIVTNELGPRLFFSSNTFLILFAAMLFVKIVAHIPKNVWNCVKVCALAALVCLVVYWGKVYYELGACKAERDALIAQAIATDADQVSLPRYPHAKYLWIPDPLNEKRMNFFKEFYGLAQDVVVDFGD